MTISNTDENDLLTAVHFGLHETPPWTTLLHRLRRRVGADAAGIAILPADAPPGRMTAIWSAPSTIGIADWAIEELAPALIATQLKPNRVYYTAELSTPPAATDNMYQSVLTGRYGLQYLRVMHVVDSHGGSAWLTVASRATDFAAADAALLSAIAPHMQIALRTLATIMDERDRTEIAHRAAAALGVGWLLLNARATVIDLDNHAEKLIAGSDAVSRSPQDRLTLEGAAANRQLTNMVRDLANDPESGPRALHLSDAPPLDLLLLPAVGRVAAHRGASVIGYLRGVAPPATATQRDLLAALFGLSGSEAAVALAISHGRTLAGTAADLGFTLETTRHYSKRVFAKTGARGQADLVRAILTSVVTLA